MFDTHCHLNFDAFENRLGEVVDNAREKGVTTFLIPGTNIQNSKLAVEIAHDLQDVFAAIGVHPTEDLENIDLERTMTKLEDLSEHEKVTAIGEIGLDYYRFKAPASLQKSFFAAQVKLAAKLDLAVTIHNRQSSKDIIEMLEKNWVPHLTRRIVYHCSPPKEDILEHALKRDIFLGVDGDITFDPTKQEFIRKVPLELLVLETDSPFLTPEPIRQNKQEKFPNEPKNLIYIAEKVAEVKGLELDMVIDQTTKNAMELFRLE